MESLHGGGARYIRDEAPDHAPSLLAFRYYGPNKETYRHLVFRHTKPRLLEPDRITDRFLRTVRFSGLTEGAPRLYDRICRDCPAPASHTDESLICLGRRIASRTGSYPRADQAHFPAAYNYLGQFIAHDLSYLKWNSENHRAQNLTSPALDLSSLFGSDPTTSSEPNDLLGPTSKGRVLDLPRAPCGETIARDGRSDSNLALAQIQVMLSRFFAVVRRRFSLDVDDAKLLTRHCFQYIVLNDYLVRVVGQDLISDISCNGRAIVTCTPFLPSVEFSSACFQFGHVMIRDSYSQWHEGDDAVQYASATALLEHTHRGRGLADVGGNRVLLDNWVLPWHKMLGDSDEGDSPPHNSFAITAGIVNAFASIPARFVETPLGQDVDVQCGDNDTLGSPVNLAVQTLLRGAQLELASGQQTTEVINRKLCGHRTPFKPIPCLTPDQTWQALAPCNAALVAHLKSNGRHFVEELPLWLYTLLESRAMPRHGILGPLSARIVAETLHAAIAEDEEGILNISFNPSVFFDEEEGNPFNLRAMVKISSQYK